MVGAMGFGLSIESDKKIVLLWECVCLEERERERETVRENWVE